MNPGTVEEAQSLLAEASEAGRKVLFVGGGTQLRPGPRPEAELLKPLPAGSLHVEQVR